MAPTARVLRHAFAALVPLTLLATTSFAAEFPKPFDTQELTEPFLTAEEARSRISLPEGFNVSVFASEPDVNQPIALATDERGRLWVAECYTYAESKTNYETKLKDRIVILEDTDGDGRFDKRTVFWDQASKLTSIEIGFGGVWALCAPDLLFIPDRDRDDVPDGEPVVILNGWNGDVIRHNIVNGLRWGPDGWLYGRHGITTISLVGAPETAPEHRTQVDCGIWRYHPIRKNFEIVCSGTTNPWGMDWDEHGQMFFINTVIGHLWHVIPGAYYQRMFGEHFDSHVYQLLPQTADHYHWDTKEAWHDIQKLGVTPTTDEAGGGHAHCGMMIYQGDNWPAKYRNQLLTCNLHGLRLNCDRLERAGATYVGKHEPDFLHTKDTWFRGIELISGADGGVYIADWSDIGECHDNDGIHRTSGRIYKVTYGQPKPYAAGDLSQLSNEELVQYQLHRNDWFVRNSRRVLQERAVAGADLKDVHRQLTEMFDREDVTRQLRAMWTLYVTGGTSEAWLLKQLHHENEHVRVWAVKLLVDVGAATAATRHAFEQLAKQESSGLVLSFLASALQQIPNGDRWELAEALANKQEFATDPVFPLMVWYGVEPAVAEYPTQAVALAASSTLPLLREHIARRITSEIERQPAAVEQLVALLNAERDASFQREILSGMETSLKGWRRAAAPPSWSAVAPKLAQSSHEQIQTMTRELSLVFGDGRAMDELQSIAKGNGADLAARRSAIHTLVEARDATIVPLLQNLLTDRDLGIDAIRGLAAFDDPKTPQLIIERYGSFHREPTRREAITTLTSRQASINALLAAVSAGTIGRDQVSPFQLRQMQLLANPDINREIDRLWPELQAISSEKLERVAQYRETLTPTVLAVADLSKGRALFNQNCGKCHQLFSTGGRIGPDLTGSQRNNLNYLLENTVDPSATVSKNFHLTMAALMEDGRVLSGILAEESERTVTMQTATERIVLLREEIEELRVSNLSMMPERQLDVMSSEQVRDLIGYLMSPSQVPLPGGVETTD